MDVMPGLGGRRILIVEDDYVIAMDLAEALSQYGAQVVGPAATVDAAFELVNVARALDGALLDVRVARDDVFAVADALRARGVPVVFSTGFDSNEIPARFCDTKCCEKPFAYEDVAATLASALLTQQRTPLSGVTLGDALAASCFFVAPASACIATSIAEIS